MAGGVSLLEVDYGTSNGSRTLAVIQVSLQGSLVGSWHGTIYGTRDSLDEHDEILFLYNKILNAIPHVPTKFHIFILPSRPRGPLPEN